MLNNEQNAHFVYFAFARPVGDKPRSVRSFRSGFRYSCLLCRSHKFMLIILGCMNYPNMVK